MIKFYKSLLLINIYGQHNEYHSSSFYEQVATLLETNYHNNFGNDYDLMINERKAESLSSLEKAWKEQALRQTTKEHEMKRR